MYGHPESGGHWENHLTEIIIESGGVPIPNHPSCFWFADRKFFLIIYVDDLLLSGPSNGHEKFWEDLSKKVWLEPFEEIDRYLGRHHIFYNVNRLPYNLLNFFQSHVEC